MARFAEVERCLESMEGKIITFRSSEQKRDGLLVYECDEQYSDVCIFEFPYPGFVVFRGESNHLRLNFVTDMFLENTRDNGRWILRVVCGGRSTQISRQEYIFQIENV